MEQAKNSSDTQPQFSGKESGIFGVTLNFGANNCCTLGNIISNLIKSARNTNTIVIKSEIYFRPAAGCRSDKHGTTTP